jgi:deoxyribose-phosphate aldolase
MTIKLTYSQLAGMIDHSLLKPEVSGYAVESGCRMADRYQVASVCVRPCDVSLAASLLASSPVKVGTVVGFPHGSSTSEVKAAEARRAIRDGAVELDMVVQISALIDGRDESVQEDIAGVVAVSQGDAIVKVILENHYLDAAQIARGCQLAEAAGAQFVKTSTGFAPSGATVEDVRLMRNSVSSTIQVKAAGGVRTLDALLAMREAGAARVGATATASMLDEAIARGVVSDVPVGLVSLA